MLRKIRALLLSLFCCTGLHAQFEPAFDVPEPNRIASIEKIRAAAVSHQSPERQIALYLYLQSLSKKNNDEAADMFAGAWLLGVKAESGMIDINAYSEAMQGLIHQSQLMDNDVLLIHLLMNFVDHLRNRHVKGASISYFLLANELADKLKDEQIPRGAFGMKYDLANELYLVGDYQKSNEIFSKMQSIPKVSLFDFFCKDLKSQIMLHLGLYDSSAWYIHLAQKQLETDTTIGKRDGWAGILTGNLAKVLFYQKQYREAVPMFKKAIALTAAAELFDNTAPFSVFLAKCYLQLGETENIATLMPVMRNAVYKNGTQQDYADMYKLILATGAGKPSPARIMELMDSAEIHQKLLAREMDENRLIQNEIKTVQQSYKQKQALLESNIQRQLMFRNLLWTFLGIVVIVAVFVIYKKNKGFQQERQVSAKRQLETENDLANARDQLIEFTRSLLEKSNRLELLENSHELNDRTDVLESLRSNNILTEQDWTNYKLLFERAYPGFLVRAQKQFPGLTPGELRFLSFIKLSFTNKEMAATLGVSGVSVRSIKSRLLKKLQLPADENLELMVEKI